MIDFVLVDHAVTNPFVCHICRSHVGPFARTFKVYERQGFAPDEEVWICETCTGRLAKTHGLVKGPRMTQLNRSAKEIDAKERELAAVAKERDDALGERDEERARADRLAADLEEARGQLDQWQHLIGTVKETLADPTAPAAV